jgi:hypothetical protein
MELSLEEMEAIRTTSKARGMSMSVWVRHIVRKAAGLDRTDRVRA